MRWIRFNDDGKATYGILEGATVKVVRGNPFDGYEESGETRAFDDVKLLVPVVPNVFYAAGLNMSTTLWNMQRSRVANPISHPKLT